MNIKSKNEHVLFFICPPFSDRQNKPRDFSFPKSVPNPFASSDENPRDDRDASRWGM